MESFLVEKYLQTDKLEEGLKQMEQEKETFKFEAVCWDDLMSEECWDGLKKECEDFYDCINE